MSQLRGDGTYRVMMRRVARYAAAACFGVIFGLWSGPRLFGQATSPTVPDLSPNGMHPLASVAPEAQATTLKTPQQLEIEQEQLLLDQEHLEDNREDLQRTEPALAHMNQSALTVETESIRGSRSSGALEVSGGYLNNLYNRPTDKLSTEFNRYSLPLSFDTSGPRTIFHAAYVPELTFYTRTESLYQSHAYSHAWMYSWSSRTTLSWQLAVAHFRDVGQFLPTVLPIGGSGIAQPVGTASSTAGSSTVTNAATSIAMQHRLSPRAEMTYTGTAAWTELFQVSSPAQPGARQILRNEPFAGDVLYERAMTPSSFLGVDGTVAYVRGLSTSTSLTYETVQGTWRYTPTRTDSFSFAAGPLFRHTSGVAPAGLASNVQNNKFTYAVNASYVHRSHFTSISAGYSRVIQLSLDNTALVAHQIAGSFVRPVTRNLVFTVDTRYIHAGSAGQEPAQTSLGGALRLDYRTGRRLGWFVNANGTYASEPTIGAASLNFSRNEIGGGVRFTLDGTQAR